MAGAYLLSHAIVYTDLSIKELYRQSMSIHVWVVTSDSLDGVMVNTLARNALQEL